MVKTNGLELLAFVVCTVGLVYLPERYGSYIGFIPGVVMGAALFTVCITILRWSRPPV